MRQTYTKERETLLSVSETSILRTHSVQTMSEWEEIKYYEHSLRGRIEGDNFDF